jgi:predicted ATPase
MRSGYGRHVSGREPGAAGTSRPRQFERVDWRPGPRYQPDAWPFTLPVVRQIVTEGGFEIPAGVTVLVGENGSGKSTLIEALAGAYPRSGVANPFVNLLGPGQSAEDSPLARCLRARTHRLASPAGFFLRAEAMHAYIAAIDSDPTQRRAWGGQLLNQQSHGESFLSVLRHRFTDVGVYFLDEPEAALSFQSCLGLLALLHDMREQGSQVVVATHSPLLASLPGATLLELGDWGVRPASYDELELVSNWRSFLDEPQRWLRHLLEP